MSYNLTEAVLSLRCGFKRALIFKKITCLLLCRLLVLLFLTPIVYKYQLLDEGTQLKIMYFFSDWNS